MISINKAINLCWTGTCKSYHAYALYALYDASISNLLALDSLRHCTDPIHYLGIQWNGADPSYGGTRETLVGSECADRENQGRFFMGRDRVDIKARREGLQRLIDNQEGVGRDPKQTQVLIRGPAIAHHLSHEMGKRFALRQYAATTGAATAITATKWVGMRYLFGTLGAIAGFLTPTCKFRFDPAELDEFADAYLEPGLALSTDKPIGWAHMGISGSLIQGWKQKGNWGKRIQGKPLDPILGAMQLFLAVGMSAQLLGLHQKLKVFSFLDSQSLLVRGGIHLFTFTV